MHSARDCVRPSLRYNSLAALSHEINYMIPLNFVQYPWKSKDFQRIVFVSIHVKASHIHTQFGISKRFYRIFATPPKMGHMEKQGMEMKWKLEMETKKHTSAFFIDS